MLACQHPTSYNEGRCLEKVYIILTRITTIFKTNPMSFRTSEVAISSLDLEGLVLRLLVAEFIVEVEERGFNLEGIMRTMMK